MQQTANYQLNQWDGEDRIMRVDFNSDNALPAMPLSAENLPLRTHPSGRILPQPTQQYHPPVPS